MMLIHFPSALFPISLIADFAAVYLDDNIFFFFSFYAAASGAVLGFASIIFGVIDLLKIPTGTEIFNTALIHGGLGFLWVIVFSIFAGVDIKYYPEIHHSTANIIVKTLAVGGLVYSNYLGGELVLKYNVGKKDKSI